MKQYEVKDGELVEKVDNNQLMLRELMDLGVDLAEYDELEAQAEYIAEQLELWKYNHREAIKKVMKERGEKTIRTPNRTYSLIEAGLSKRLDTAKVKKYLQEQGIEDDFTIFTETKEQLRIAKRR